MRLTHSIEIACTPEHLWPFLNDPERIQQWMHGVVEDRPTSPGPRGVGSTFEMKIQEGAKVVEYTGEIVAYEPYRLLGLKLSGGSFQDMEVFVDYTLEDLGTPEGPGAGRTRLSYLSRIGTEGLFFRLFGWIFKRFARRRIRAFFSALKERAEATAPPGRSAPGA